MPITIPHEHARASIDIQIGIRAVIGRAERIAAWSGDRSRPQSGMSRCT
jgi:hypothetical protein